ncbi:MAG: hypothetical protein ACK5NM_13180, partial [Cyclobacteriaceae bacterium]
MKTIKPFGYTESSVMRIGTGYRLRFRSAFRLAIVMLVAVFYLASCTPKPKTLAELNPPAEGFDLVHSDPAAIQLADSIMHVMGGRENWDKTRFISWNFFGRRDLSWDKHTGSLR